MTLVVMAVEQEYEGPKTLAYLLMQPSEARCLAHLDQQKLKRRLRFHLRLLFLNTH